MSFRKWLLFGVKGRFSSVHTEKPSTRRQRSTHVGSCDHCEVTERDWGSDSEGIWRLSPSEQWTGGCDEKEEDSRALPTSWIGRRETETRQGNEFHMQVAGLFSHSKTITLSITSHCGYIDVPHHCHYSGTPLYVISLAPQWAPALPSVIPTPATDRDAAVCCLRLLGGDLRRL